MPAKAPESGAGFALLAHLTSDGGSFSDEESRQAAFSGLLGSLAWGESRHPMAEPDS